ncbi:hypothetical protein [Paracoccus kondratievae]|nr:hypothetical protein [Paracoccus kondratievae]SMG21887.1 hypothetical protein SAMN02746000_01191 [Paracoccus sp. J56]
MNGVEHSRRQTCKREENDRAHASAEVLGVWGDPLIGYAAMRVLLAAP